MPEYVIGTADGDDWPVPAVGLAAAFLPESHGCEVLQDDGLFVFRFERAAVGASRGPGGTRYVDAEGALAPEAADGIVARTVCRLAATSGRRTVHHRITG
ncbi:hypothetical protein [Streptomyces sp. NPDC093094]|uniref:hypothetical protein n=1 Tax=Streptomyces sp. NPDC093094 TaxID=3366026 RepID=UPI00380F343B